MALVTGASSGIGRAIALRFGAKGMRVGLVARRKDRLAQVGAAIEKKGGQAHVLPGDVRDSKVADASVRSVVDAWSRLDVLVNNAGIGAYAPLEQLKDETMRQQFEVNVFGPFYFVRAAVPVMKKQKSGQIVNIGSVAGLVGTARGTAYVGTKWALRGMNECWREELYPDGIKVAKEDFSVPDAEWALTPDDVAHAVECIVDQGPNSDIKEIVVQVRDRS